MAATGFHERERFIHVGLADSKPLSPLPRLVLRVDDQKGLSPRLPDCHIRINVEGPSVTSAELERVLAEDGAFLDPGL